VKYSMGWKQYAPGDEPEAILAAADAALYNNKRASKAPVATADVGA